MKATVVFVIQNNKILLARKMKKIGAGKLNGYGGKPEPEDISIRHTACRELFEESGKGILVTPDNLSGESTVDFYFHDNKTTEPNWSVVFYLAHTFTGTATSTEEMSDPHWFNLNKIPYDEMLPADRIILEKLLSGKHFNGFVRFNEEKTDLLESRFTEEDSVTNH